MAKQQRKNATGTTKKNKNKGNKSGPLEKQILDVQARAYARLIADPCGAPLALPCLPGGTGQLIRLRTKISLSDITSGYTGTLAGASFFVLYDPWYASFTHKLVSADTVNMNAAAGATASTGQDLNTANVPSFLQNTTSRYRPIAGCVKFINYSPSNVIGGKLATINDAPRMLGLATTDAVTYASVASNVDYIRCPLSAEIIFRPKNNPAFTSRSDAASNFGAIGDLDQGMCFVGTVNGTTASPNDYDIVAEFVYEYMPFVNSGQPPKHASSTSMFSADQIVNAIGNGLFSNIGERAVTALAGATSLGRAAGTAYTTYKALRGLVSSPTPFQPQITM